MAREDQVTIAGGTDVQAVQHLAEARERIRKELSRAIVGMEAVIEEVMMAIVARGHALLEGVPGLAKTRLISSLANCMSLSFHRIQFTPDLMPGDITGTEILQDDPETGRRKFMFAKGPIFANVILADEINRTPPKTQAALLEAMQERQVSISGENHRMADPFFVLATQNPLEQEGTYPLPEAQLDRFMFKIYVDYPSESEEVEIMRTITSQNDPTLNAVLTGEEILSIQSLVKKVPVADHILKYASRLVRLTRPSDDQAPDFVKKYLTYGCGPRAGLYLVLGGKARAILQGRFHVSVDDVKAVALPVMRHRMGLNFAAQSEGVDTDDIVRRMLDAVPSDEKLYA